MTRTMIRLLAIMALCAAPAVADAAVTMNVSQVGADVVVTANGTFDTAGAQSYVTEDRVKGVLGTVGYLAIGSGAAATNYAATIPMVMTSTALGGQSIGSGPAIGFSTDFNTFFVDSTYVSNSQIDASGTFSRVTIDQLGLFAGSYAFTVGTNDVTLNIGPQVAAVPEPGTWAMMLVGFGMVAGMARYRRRPTKQAAAIAVGS